MSESNLPATTSSTLVHSKGLMPKSFRHLINGADHLAEAFEIGCKGIRDTTKGIDEIASLMLSQQKDRLTLELAGT